MTIYNCRDFLHKDYLFPFFAAIVQNHDTAGDNFGSGMDGEENDEEEELRRLEEIAILNSIYYRNFNKFQRNSNLSHVVHAVMNLAQLLSVLMNELFHHVHHAINRKIREKNPTVPNLPEERNPIFIAYPICMTVSLVLGVLWLRFRNFGRILDTTLVGCAIGILLMLLAATLSMRHAEIYINLEEVSDDELLTHPVFIHNFIMCVLAILAMVFYLIHFWIVFECWLWRKGRAAEDSTLSLQSQEDARRNPQPSTSRRNESSKSRDLDPILRFKDLKEKLLNVDEANWDNEPVILYCCCVDFWKYIKERKARIPDHEFQVVHVK